MAVRNQEMKTLMSLSFFTIAAGRQFKLLCARAPPYFAPSAAAQPAID